MKARLVTFQFLIPEDCWKRELGHFGAISAGFMNSKHTIGFVDYRHVETKNVDVKNLWGYEVDWEDWFYKNNNE